MKINVTCFYYWDSLLMHPLASPSFYTSSFQVIPRVDDEIFGNERVSRFKDLLRRVCGLNACRIPKNPFTSLSSLMRRTDVDMHPSQGSFKNLSIEPTIKTYEIMMAEIHLFRAKKTRIYIKEGSFSSVFNKKYRVIEKEGQKLQGYYPTCKCFLGAVYGLISITS